MALVGAIGGRSAAITATELSAKHEVASRSFFIFGLQISKIIICTYVSDHRCILWPRYVTQLQHSPTITAFKIPTAENLKLLNNQYLRKNPCGSSLPKRLLSNPLHRSGEVTSGFSVTRRLDS
jgi:hypothetical protein